MVLLNLISDEKEEIDLPLLRLTPEHQISHKFGSNTSSNLPAVTATVPPLTSTISPLSSSSSSSLQPSSPSTQSVTTIGQQNRGTTNVTSVTTGSITESVSESTSPTGSVISNLTSSTTPALASTAAAAAVKSDASLITSSNITGNTSTTVATVATTGVVTSVFGESTVTCDSGFTEVTSTLQQQQQQQQLKSGQVTSGKMVTVSGTTNESFNSKKLPVKKLHSDVISLGSSVAKVTGIKTTEIITGPSDDESSSDSSDNSGGVPIYGVKVENEKELAEIMKDIDYWGMNIFQVRECTDGYPLTAVFYTILRVSISVYYYNIIFT